MLRRGINLHSFDDEATTQVSNCQHWCTLCGDHMRRQPEMVSTDWTDREELCESGMETHLPLVQTLRVVCVVLLLFVCFSVWSLYTAVVDIDIALVNIHS